MSAKDYNMYRYYKGEKENPFIGIDNTKAMWWDGERIFFDNATNDPGFIKRVSNSLQDSINSGSVSDFLLDESIAFNKRALVYYLDIWHSKWFPYDSLDVIFEY